MGNNIPNSFMNITEDQISATHALQGKILSSGWNVVEKVKSKPGGTGGSFSVCYIVEKDGQVGFLKALNVLAFLRGGTDLLSAMTETINTYNFEKELLSRCRNSNFSRVSRLLEAGMENLPEYLISNVYYMICEKADGDVRSHLDFSQAVDVAWKLRSLHNIATGLKQLHSINISHQDLKPSNVFVFDQAISKLGDLGRSLCQDLAASHSNLDFSGDLGYAPPEVFHGFALPEWENKVYAIDCYLLGSMATYYFTGLSMTALLSRNLDKRINVLTLNFESALPYWIEAFDNAVHTIEQHLGDYSDIDRLISAIQMLCYPDPRLRGHKKNIVEIGSNYILDRFVGIFNLLASRSESKLTK